MPLISVAFLSLLSHSPMPANLMKQSQQGEKPVSPAISVKYAEDHASEKSIVAALYQVISGPAGQKRDWDRFKSLFSAKGSLSALVKNREGKTVLAYMTPQDYIDRSGPVLEQRGFFEKEVKNVSQKVGNLTVILSDYESRSNLADEKPFQTGTNSIQLYFDGSRWFIHSVLWEGK